MKSIALKLWVSMAALVVFMLILLWFFQIVFLKSFYLNRQISQVKAEGVAAAEELGDIWNNADIEAVEIKLQRILYSFKSSVDIIDADGNFIYSSDYSMGYSRGQGRGPMMRWRTLQTNVIREVLEGRMISLPTSHPMLNTEIMLIGIPIRSSNGIVGGMIISMPLAPVNETAEALKQQLIIITFILLAAALVLSYFLSKAFTKPMLEINRAAAAMASGDLSVRLEHKSGDEIGKLANTMNYLANQLAKIEQLRRDLIANVSHELRTPLSLIRGYAETIRDVSGENRDKREKQLGIIIEESERLKRMVDDILNLSQMQAGYVKLELQNFKLNTLLEDIIKRYEILSESTGVNVVVQIEGEPVVRADESRLEQVLYNLLNNAFNYTPEKGMVKVNAVDKGSTVRIEVADTGPGIPREELEHIWERYYKADKSTEKRNMGTGLGLAIVKAILEAHNSRFGVSSREGSGTTFWFELEKGTI